MENTEVWELPLRVRGKVILWRDGLLPVREGLNSDAVRTGRSPSLQNDPPSVPSV